MYVPFENIVLATVADDEISHVVPLKKGAEAPLFVIEWDMHR